MKPINHLVITGHDLAALRALYGGLGFTLCPQAQHPFGTGNTVIQLHGAYLELLSVTVPEDVVEHRQGAFSFSAFNRDYLARHEGFSMLVLGTQDARADIDAWSLAGLTTYAPFDFSREASLPDGDKVTVGFTLAFTSTPEAPWLGHFACQHFLPDYYEQPQYLKHANGAYAVEDVWIVSDRAAQIAHHVAVFVGGRGVPEGGTIAFATPSGRIVLSDAESFAAAFGVPPPHPGDGPHLAGLTIACRGGLGMMAGKGLERVGSRLVLPPARAFGTALAFHAIG
ncbi:MAG: VOC family protein [Rhizobiaceae bacterium]|nr:VOC family protein [Rhizobiaceae bacterium]